MFHFLLYLTRIQITLLFFMFYGECGVAKCCYDKGYLHCGFCPDLPCTELQQAFNHPEHGDHGERLANLKNWAKGDETILRLRTFPKKV